MQYSVIALFALYAGAFASVGSRYNRLAPRQNSVVPVGAPAMTDANGNVVPFDPSRIVKSQ
ncbi:hypothetical protein SODALDRAFT_326905 [Sodiomyces alkalinus F11]|uniref:Uncharacterized protein n=1 Tax=Sodiomyces alkalinus (strain CBS 110278 / VKM F-3762 / F11) TaxID=1314773 RepID=A0A3N2Q7W0_SODAK|nr:hypothetical protein SODALDRAFT_326905 [Sodiomyces alkalinus F11]ROT42748.1 hypothetical protein SODALDRAFT_326905 [Sodiomyces alkalinus F11]